MKINRENYEAYFLDYHEGQLSPEMAEEVLLFVEYNPDLKDMFDEFVAVSLVADHGIVFEKKLSLRKHQVLATSKINEKNYEEYLVSETEGLLNAVQLAALEEFISINPQVEKDRLLYAAAHLSTENNEVFEGKQLLKHPAIPVGPIDADTFETFMARELENDLSPDEKLEFAEFMHYNIHLEQDRKLYTLTLLGTATDIVFQNKNLLKHTVIPIRRLLFYAVSAAASLALVFSVYFLLHRNEIPVKIARQDNLNGIINNALPEPTIVKPVNQIASTNGKSADVASTAGKTTGNIAGTNINNALVTSPVPEPVANVDRHNVESLEARSEKEVTTRQFVDPQFTFIRISQMHINQNMELYYNLKLAEDIQYAQVNSKDKNPAKTILNAATGKADDLFAVNRNAPPREEKKNLSLWTFAEFGVQTLNTITSSEIELNLQKDEQGKVVAYELQSGLLNFEKEMKR
jgi:hypothetical protein